MDIPASIEDDFNRWYNEEHIAERVGIPGFLNGRRYLAIDGVPKYVALYETVDPQVLKSESYLKVSNHPTPWTERVRPHFQNFVRNEYELLLTLGTLPDGAAPYVLTVRLETEIDPGSKNTEQFSAVLSYPVFVEGREVLPAGSRVEGEVRGSKKRIVLSPQHITVPCGQRMDFNAATEAEFRCPAHGELLVGILEGIPAKANVNKLLNLVWQPPRPTTRKS